MSFRRLLVAVLLVLLPFLLLLIILNVQSIYEGLSYYVRFAVLPPQPLQPVSRTGRYASMYDLVKLRNAERYRYLVDHLHLPFLTVAQIPIPNFPEPDLLVTFGGHGPYTVFCTHYDKAYDDPEYEGASDNTAAVSVLLSASAEMNKRGYVGNTAFLFSGQEESGLGGAAAFVRYVHEMKMQIREVVDFDSLGRGRLTVRPSTDYPGFVFSVPLYGEITYDGNQFRRSPPYQLPSPRLVASLIAANPDLLVLGRFTALSDSNVFQANGIDTVAISAEDMHYLEMAWDTYADRVELLDERNLDRAFELVFKFPSETSR